MNDKLTFTDEQIEYINQHVYEEVYRCVFSDLTSIIDKGMEVTNGGGDAKAVAKAIVEELLEHIRVLKELVPGSPQAKIRLEKLLNHEIEPFSSVDGEFVATKFPDKMGFAAWCLKGIVKDIEKKKSKE